MAQLDVRRNDDKGWTCIKESGAISTLKTFAKKSYTENAVFRILENDVVTLVGEMRENGSMRWGKGNGKTRIECHLGINDAPVKCACGTDSEISYNTDTSKYKISCVNESCPAMSESTHSAVVIKNWNKMRRNQ